MRTTLHPACLVLSWQQGCNQGSAASPGLCEAANAAAAAPKPLPQGHSPGRVARMGPSASTILLPPAPALASCGRALVGGCSQLSPHRPACTPGPLPVPQGHQSPGPSPPAAKRALATISAGPRAHFLQYFHNILVWGRKKKNPQIFSPQFGNSPPKAGCLSSWRDIPRDSPSHLPAPALGTVCPPPCVPLPAPGPPSLAAGCGRSSVT